MTDFFPQTASQKNTPAKAVSFLNCLQLPSPLSTANSDTVARSLPKASQEVVSHIQTVPSITHGVTQRMVRIQLLGNQHQNVKIHCLEISRNTGTCYHISKGTDPFLTGA